jgi:hypothetical protein
MQYHGAVAQSLRVGHARQSTHRRAKAQKHLRQPQNWEEPPAGLEIRAWGSKSVSDGVTESFPGGPIDFADPTPNG